ncbi:24328_t:CDS:2, partial [Gigaspora margarita]
MGPWLEAPVCATSMYYTLIGIDICNVSELSDGLKDTVAERRNLCWDGDPLAVFNPHHELTWRREKIHGDNNVNPAAVGDEG